MSRYTCNAHPDADICCPNWPTNFNYKNCEVFSKILLSHEALEDLSYPNDESPSMGVFAPDFLGDASPNNWWTPIQIFVDDNDPAVEGDDLNFHRGKIAVKITYDPAQDDQGDWFIFDGTNPAEIDQVIELVCFHISALKDHSKHIRPFVIEGLRADSFDVWPERLTETFIGGDVDHKDVVNLTMWQMLDLLNADRDAPLGFDKKWPDGKTSGEPWEPYHSDWKDGFSDWFQDTGALNLAADLSSQAGLDAWLAHMIETDLADKPNPDWGGVFGMFFSADDLPLDYLVAVDQYNEAVKYGDDISKTYGGKE